jgi:hypothetical protein
MTSALPKMRTMTLLHPNTHIHASSPTLQPLPISIPTSASRSLHTHTHTHAYARAFKPSLPKRTKKRRRWA